MTTLISSDGRQPVRFEKKRNTLPSYPGQHAPSSRVRSMMRPSATQAPP